VKCHPLEDRQTEDRQTSIGGIWDGVLV